MVTKYVQHQNPFLLAIHERWNGQNAGIQWNGSMDEVPVKEGQ
jgi:hypothetical protein